MKRYSTEHDDEPFEFDTGEYVLYEEAHQVEIDRDIKAANLQLLVDAVLAYNNALEVIENSLNAALEDTLYDAAQTAGEAMLDLARGLKQ